MMIKITRKGPVADACSAALDTYQQSGLSDAVVIIDERLLQNKVKFPLLEYASLLLHEGISANDQIAFFDQVAALHTEGGNVLLGKGLQLRLEEHFEESFAKACEYIILGDKWYCCDIIGERVFGYSLLTQAQKTLPEFKRLSKHHSHWVVRSLGAGAHYAIKKGLDKSDVQQVFRLLLSMANTKNQAVKQGVGWAAKTTAKFHPEIIEFFAKEINNEDEVANWFRTKIDIGLMRHQYAKRN